MSIPELKKHDNGVWYVCWTDGRRSKRVSTRTSNLDEAKAFLGQWLLMAQADVKESEVLYTCADLWTFYMNGKVKKRGLRDEFPDRIWRLHLESTFGNLPITAITQKTVDAYAAKRVGEGAALSTVWNEVNRLRASWNWAVKKRLLGSEKLPDVEALAPPEARKRWLSREEIDRLLQTASALREGEKLWRGEIFCWLALETAARKDAIEKLKWEHVDFETGVVNYAAQGFTARKKKVAVPISDNLLPVLRRAHAERTSQWVLGNSGCVKSVLNRILARAGLTDVSPHTLRHTAATHMMRNGVDVWLVAGVLGNSVAMIEKVYGHHAPDAQRPAVNAISGGRFKVVA